MCARSRRLGLIALVSLISAVERVGAQARHGSIHGVVTDSAGAPLRGATLRIAGTVTRRLSGPTGRFAFEHMTPGRYLLAATMIGALPTRDSVVVRAGDTTRVRFALVVKPFVPETLPPRFARGTRPDTALEDAETIDLVAEKARLPVLRTHPPGNGRKELRLWMDGGIAIPMNLVRLAIDGERVHGEIVHWIVHPMPDREVDPRRRAFMDTVPDWLRRSFGCGRVTTDTLHHAGAQAGYRNSFVAVCTSQFRPEPDWRRLLRELEAHRVWTLPDASELPTVGNIVSLDGYGMTVEAWNGSRYRSYSFSNPESIPAPEGRELAEIHRILVAFLTRISENQR